MIHRTTTSLNQPVTIAGLNVTVDLTDDGDVLLQVETPERNTTLLEEFASYHRMFPEVFDEFVAECRQRIQEKRPVRAREVLIHVRRQRRLKYGPGRIALRNEFAGLYAALSRGLGTFVASDTDTEVVQRAIADT